ncbi:hypothetical protein HY734_01710 [Candidatus Uhrbacteria bacterium]|nr:hypothetical protein [Candidatus Uhrbacteria bacterium]
MSAHAAILKEYKFAIDHLVPTVPEVVKEEAKSAYEALKEKEYLTEEEVTEALVKTGRAEYPHRHAYRDLTQQLGESHRVEAVLEHAEPAVEKKLRELLHDTSASLDEVLKSSLFEDSFTPEERYQIQDGVMHAEEHMQEEMTEVVEKHRKEYDALVETYARRMAEIDAQLEQLRALANQDPKWKDEIVDKVRTLEAGWSVTERDPELELIKKEIEYWRGTLGEDV